MTSYLIVLTTHIWPDPYLSVSVVVEGIHNVSGPLVRVILDGCIEVVNAL